MQRFLFAVAGMLFVAGMLISLCGFQGTLTVMVGPQNSNGGVYSGITVGIDTATFDFPFTVATGSISGTTMTITAMSSSGFFTQDQDLQWGSTPTVITNSACPANTQVLTQTAGVGSQGASGLGAGTGTYTLSESCTLASGSTITGDNTIWGGSGEFGSGGNTTPQYGCCTTRYPTEPTPLHTQWNGRYPDFSAILGGVSLGGSTNTGFYGYPWRLDYGIMSINGSGGKYAITDPTSDLAVWNLAAAGDAGLMAAWKADLDSVAKPYLSTLRVLRVNREWIGSNTWSPWIFGYPCNIVLDPTPCCGFGNTVGGINGESCPTIPPATYVAGVRNFINVARQELPGVLILHEGPSNDIEAMFDPGDAYVDLTGQDIYYGPQSGVTDAQYWASDGGDGVTIPFCQVAHQEEPCRSYIYMAQWSKTHNRPIAISEWCDAYNTGYITNHFAAWGLANNLVQVGVWDGAGANGAGPYTFSGNNAIPPGSCHMADNPNTLAAWNATFASVPTYTGTYFKHMPIAPSNPPGNPFGF